MIKIGINGFGRIGRLAFRSTVNRKDVQVVAINDLLDVDYLAYMLKYDSVHGAFDGTVDVKDGKLIVNGNEIRITAERNPADLKWDEVGAEYVIESTGFFLTEETAGKHLQAGAKKVVGIEGRQLYVDRSKFIAECAGLSNVEFEQGDVRHISKEKTGSFDLVLFFGILHHLSSEDYFPMLKSLADVTDDTLMLYTHTSEPGWEVKFKLSEEITNDDGLKGRLYREHPDGATAEQKKQRIRNSIDNTFSFWAREASLFEALKRAGFKYISKQLAPMPYSKPTEEFRVFYICRK